MLCPKQSVALPILRDVAEALPAAGSRRPRGDVLCPEDYGPPYQGPEPVLDFLNRVNGLPPGSRLNQVYVVRPNVATGGRPEVFRVDPDDPGGTSNIALQPADQVYVGETRGSSFARVLPPWSRSPTRHRRERVASTTSPAGSCPPLGGASIVCGSR